MSINSVNGVNGAQGTNGANRVDEKELEVARKLISAGLVSSVQEFLSLSEPDKKLKVEQYNRIHPNNPIGDKANPANTNKVDGTSESNNQGSEMSKFMKDVDWDKIKLQ